MTKTLDRELLTFFKTLYETRNLVAAANEVQVPAATASRMLSKLRGAFDDDLFTRCATGLTPNWRAQEAMPVVEQLLAGYDRLLADRVFDPASLKREFRVACADHAMLFLAPGVAQAVKAAPGVTVNFQPLTDDWQSELKNGGVDVAVSPLETLPEGFHVLTLREAKNCVIARPGHPLEKRLKEAGRLAFEELLQYQFVEVVYRPSTYFRQMKSEEAAVLSRRRVAVRVPYFFGAVRLVAASDLIALMSDAMCEWLVPKDLLSVLPVEGCLEESFRPRLIWHDRSHADPAMQWFRSLLLEGCRSARS